MVSLVLSFWRLLQHLVKMFEWITLVNKFKVI